MAAGSIGGALGFGLSQMETVAVLSRCHDILFGVGCQRELDSGPPR